MALALRYSARSDVGLIREINEDSGYAGPRLLVIADGVGGHAAGEIAATIAVNVIVQRLERPTWSTEQRIRRSTANSHTCAAWSAVTLTCGHGRRSPRCCERAAGSASSMS
jgi:serine/threonine protein phosphatase PrpC